MRELRDLREVYARLGLLLGNTQGEEETARAWVQRGLTDGIRPARLDVERVAHGMGAPARPSLWAAS